MNKKLVPCIQPFPSSAFECLFIFTEMVVIVYFVLRSDCFFFLQIASRELYSSTKQSYLNEPPRTTSMLSHNRFTACFFYCRNTYDGEEYHGGVSNEMFKEVKMKTMIKA